MKKKKEMSAQMNNRFNNMNEAGVEALFNIIMQIPDRERWMVSTSLERIAELDSLDAKRELEEKMVKKQQQEEAEQQANAKRNKLYNDFARMFDAINTVDIPLRYDLGIEEIKAIDFVCGNIIKCFPEYALSVANNYFCYGFANGMKYAKTQARKTTQKKKIVKGSNL